MPFEMSDPSEQKSTCPRCFGAVDTRARVCPHCEFEISKYNANFANCKTTGMQKCNAKEWVRSRKREGMRAGFGLMGTAILLIPVGVVFWISFGAIPFVGWVLGAIATAGWVGLLGAGFKKLLSSATGASLDQSDEAKAENTYTNIDCPNCQYCFADARDNGFYAWPTSGMGTLICPACKTACYRIGHELLWVPFPSVTLNGNITEYVGSMGESTKASNN